MKICIIGNDYKQQFPLVGYGGIESSFENLCLGLSKYFSKEYKFCAFVPKIIEKNNTEYDFKIIETNFIESSRSGLPSVYFARDVKDIIAQSDSKPDVIWSYSAWSAKVLEELNIPIICTIMDSGGWEEGKFIYKENVFYRFASKFIFDLVFKDADTHDHINKIKSQSCWFHTGMADEEFDFCSEKEDYNLWVAGLNWGYTNKGLDLFVEMAKNRSDQNFVVYGTGNTGLEEYLKSLSKELRNLEYLGSLQRGQQHRDVFKKAKLFTFLTQIPEAFGRTGLEAITKGTPVLGSTKGAVPELYEPAGICTDNFNEMLQALDKVYDYNSVYEYAEKFHIKHEINFLLETSKTIIK